MKHNYSLSFFLGFMVLLAAASAPLLPVQASKSPLAGAQRVEKVLDQIEADYMAGGPFKSHELSEADLNDFLEVQLQASGQEGVKKVQVKLKDRNTFATFITADLDKVQISDSSMAARLMQGLLQGTQNLEVEGMIESDGGRGSYQVEKATVNGYQVPATVVSSLLKSIGTRQTPPFDPTEPFPLPLGIQKIEIASGKVTLHTMKR